jgi:hypothetical protein
VEATTEAPATSAENKSSGCRSSITAGAACFVIVASCAVYVTKKKDK